jgi:5'-nucleotidase
VLSTAGPAEALPVDIQILGTNDFHGRLLPNSGEAGAAQFAGAVAQLECDNANTIFAAAGDLIGASTFESFIQRDKPTLDALNAAGLDVTAAGNHEFDGGYRDLVDRVMAPYDATNNPEGGAQYQYIAANVRKRSNGSYALPDITARTPDPQDHSDGGSWTTTIAGVKVGFVGAVTEDLPSLVSPAGIADVQVTSIVNEANAAADALKADGADVVILLVHEGATSTSPSSINDGSAFARIVNGVDGDVSAIISGHTHLAYNFTDSRGRPVVSAGQYGTNLNKLVLTVDPTTDSVVVKQSQIVPAATLPLTCASATAKKAEVQKIVDDAVAKASVLGARVLGKIGGPFNRATLPGGAENRGGESTLGNLVAEVQRWATSAPEAGSAQIAFMNPGGLRADLVGNSTNGYPADLTYKQAAVVQPFANTLVNMKMTGAQIKTVLEQQWQRDDKGQVPSRPFLRLGTSEGFLSTYDARRPEGDRITGMWLDGQAIQPGTTYSVTVNSFLASGGDNFRAFRLATAVRDTGKSDLQAMVDYMAEKATKSPLPVDYQQHFVGVQWPADKPRFYRVGQRVNVALSSLAMTNPKDRQDGALTITTKNAKLRNAKVDNTVDPTPFDESGRSDVSVRLTGKTRPGSRVLTFSGVTTGSTFSLPIQIRKALPIARAGVKQDRVVVNRTRTKVRVRVTAAGLDRVWGNVVVVKAGGKKYLGKLKDGKVVVELDPFKKTGEKNIVVRYRGSRVVRGTRLVTTVDVKRR